MAQIASQTSHVCLDGSFDFRQIRHRWLGIFKTEIKQSHVMTESKPNNENGNRVDKVILTQRLRLSNSS